MAQCINMSGDMSSDVLLIAFASLIGVGAQFFVFMSMNFIARKCSMRAAKNIGRIWFLAVLFTPVILEQWLRGMIGNYVAYLFISWTCCALFLGLFAGRKEDFFRMKI